MPRKKGEWPASGFGSRLKQIREVSGMSQAKLAQEASCSLFTVSRLERGLQEPAWPLVLALASALGVGPERFQAD